MRDDRRGGDLNFTGINHCRIGNYPNGPPVPKIAAQFSRRSIKRDEPAVVGGEKDARAARAPHRRRTVPPRDTATNEAVRVVNPRIDFWIEAPELTSGTGIERADFIEGRTQEQLSIVQNRRGLERRATHRF